MSSSPVHPEQGSGGSERPTALPTSSDALRACRDRCRDALGAYSADGRNLDVVRAAIHSLAAVACRHQVSPEQMLIDLKAMLADAPAIRDLQASRADAARAELVSVAIRAYFGEPGL